MKTTSALPKKKASASARKRKPAPLGPMDYLRIGRQLGRMGYCGECAGCVCYRDFCDWAEALREYERGPVTAERVSGGGDER